jgi:uncharacterized RDD family membrane protein YckC
MYFASWGQRFGGYIIDALILAVPSLLGTIISAATSSDGSPTAAGTMISVLFSLVSFGLAVYNRWYLGGTTGQTWGRRALNIRLVSAQTGQPIGMGMAFVRDLCHFVDSIICYIGWLFPLWDQRKQTIADKIVNTVVVPAR